MDVIKKGMASLNRKNPALVYEIKAIAENHQVEDEGVITDRFGSKSKQCHHVAAGTSVPYRRVEKAISIRPITNSNS
ncbi:MAG: hypothetical protein U0Z17_04320 [Bacteroidales bacterium]